MSKYTGWKVPLLFCAAAGLMVMTVWLWRQWTNPVVPPLDPALLTQARTLLIDLEKDAEGQELKRRISSDGTALGTREQKDARLLILANEAVQRGRYDAACAATILVYNDFKRDEILSMVAYGAAKNCADLPWGAFVTKGFSHVETRAEIHAMLNARFADCARAKTAGTTSAASHATNTPQSTPSRP